VAADGDTRDHQPLGNGLVVEIVADQVEDLALRALTSTATFGELGRSELAGGRGSIG
jgi:hypothetical protein